MISTRFSAFSVVSAAVQQVQPSSLATARASTSGLQQRSNFKESRGFSRAARRKRAILTADTVSSVPRCVRRGMSEQQRGNVWGFFFGRYLSSAWRRLRPETDSNLSGLGYQHRGRERGGGGGRPTQFTGSWCRVTKSLYKGSVFHGSVPK